MSEVLIVEPEASERARLCAILANHGHDVFEARGLDDAGAARPLPEYDLVLTNHRLTVGSSHDLLARAGTVPVVFFGRDFTVRAAVDAILAGAADCIDDPDDSDTVAMRVGRALARAIERECPVPEVPIEATSDGVMFGMVGRSARMNALFEQIRRVAPTESTVLVEGESGTGKELVARALHAESSRRHAPMISLNCAAIPDTLIESELFGNERGAFTGASAARVGLVEAADGGTLFLDEIGELPIEAQARLLRVLQEGEIRRVGATQTRRVSVRLIAATHRDLRRLAQEGRFREDLFYRLNVVNLRIPPLREREEDILTIADYLLEKSGRRLGRLPLYFSDDAVDAIRAYRWPGNVRELENAIERAVILSDGDEIRPEGLAIDPGRGDDDRTPSADHERPAPLDENVSLEDYFVRFVKENQDTMTETELAQKLGISRKSLWERRQRLGIPRKRTRNKGPLSSRRAGAGTG